MKFIAEKVVHKPLVIAYHAEGSDWEMTATSSGKTKFWGKYLILPFTPNFSRLTLISLGKSFEIIPTGVSRVKIGQDVFEW